MKIKLKGNIITPNRLIENGEICFEDRIIEYAGALRNNDCEYFVTDYSGLFISPGFIDVHVHGGGGADFMDGTSEAFETVSAVHLKHGTTSMLATTLTCKDEELFSIFDTLKLLKDQGKVCNISGLHLEGPYFSVNQKGAQDEKYIKLPKAEHYKKIIDKSHGLIKRWSAAPELENALEFGRYALKNGIAPTIGHSDAEYSTALEAYDNGFTHLTHFYSGMSTITRRGGFRHPGLIESGYIIDGMTVEIICDGCHLPPELVSLVYKSKGAERTVLVTDALRGAGTDCSTMILGSLDNGYEVIIEDGVAKLPDRSAFAGSIATADRLVRNALHFTGCDICNAVKMITYTPAGIFGMNKKGLLRTGYDADIAVFDSDINIKAVYCGGELKTGE